MYRDRSLVVFSQESYGLYIAPTIRNNYVPEPTPLGNNQWTYYAARNSVGVKSASGTAGWLEVNLGLMRQGDIIELECEVMNKTSTALHFKLERYTGSSWGNIIEELSKKENEWEQIKLRAVVPIGTDGLDHRLIIGLMSAESGEYEIRNIVVRVNTRHQPVSLIHEFRQFLIRKNAGVWEVRTDSASDGATITEASATTMQLTFTKPFISTLKPLAYATFDFASDGYKYVARVSGSSRTAIQLRIYDDAAANALKNLSDIADGVHINLLLISGAQGQDW